MSAPALAAPAHLIARPLRARLLAADEMAHRGPAWDRLVERAADPNPFFSRRVIDAHAANGIAPPPRFLAVEDGAELLALLPVVPRGRRIGLWRRAGCGWGSPYTCSGTPLVAAHRVEEAIEALLDGLEAASASFWLLPALGGGGRVTQALRAGLARRAWPHGVLSAGERAVLRRRPDYAAYAAELSRNRRKALRRQQARLAERGRLEHRWVQDGPGLDEAVSAFLALEARGWKGRRGTALGLRPATEQFARALFMAPPRPSDPVRPRADLLLLDGRPVAVSLALLCGGTAHLLKSAYDEAYRVYGPGVLLENAIVHALHEQGFAGQLDSCALPGTPLDDLYPDRVTLGDLLLHAGPLPADRFLGVAAAEAAIRRRSTEARSRVGRLRRLVDRLLPRSDAS